MTGTDERCNSCSRSGTPSRGDNLIPQPVFQPDFVVELGDKDFPAPKIKREGIKDVGPQLGAFFKSSKDLTHNLYFFK